MNLAYTDEERAFREEVRAFVAERLPDDILRKVRDGEEALVKDEYYRWHTEL
jgi:alkylation response protein AidB-like acyl-CoA dehydrogenase